MADRHNLTIKFVRRGTEPNAVGMRFWGGILCEAVEHVNGDTVNYTKSKATRLNIIWKAPASVCTSFAIFIILITTAKYVATLMQGYGNEIVFLTCWSISVSIATSVAIAVNGIWLSHRTMVVAKNIFMLTMFSLICLSGLLMIFDVPRDNDWVIRQWSATAVGFLAGVLGMLRYSK